ncbi:MAG: hypothetical protein JXA73_07745 [Acidobacteria bacterium]|nr:hypothetical protein [Acidobacteriota bacterium]
MKRIIAVIAGLTLLFPIFGCHTTKVLHTPTPSIQNPEAERIVGITTKAGEEISFQPPGGVIREGKLDARVKNQPYNISLDQIDRFWIERRELSTSRTVGLVAGIVLGTIAAAAIIIAATKESCPFIYSWNGKEYVFDSEPYGGAVTRGLERDDYSELEHLVPDKGMYRLMIKNEVEETQFTNLMELIVTDHSAGRVAMDSAGNLYTLESLQAPEAVVDENGRDLLLWLKETDKRIWELESEKNSDRGFRQEIRLAFPKPPEAVKAKLVVNGGTSLWGSYMIKELLQLRGSDVYSWYSSIDNNPADRSALQAWNEREELFMLKIEVEEPGGWVQRGLLLGGGPFVLEYRVVDLDVSHVKGDRLNIRIRPPKGFWAFNSFAADYSPNQAVTMQTLHPIKCRDSEARDRLPQIARIDDSYYDMPNLGDHGYLSFKAPARESGLNRTIFLHTRGYYQIHLNSSGKADSSLLTRIMAIPDTAARLSGLRYAEWQQQARR